MSSHYRLHSLFVYILLYRKFIPQTVNAFQIWSPAANSWKSSNRKLQTRLVSFLSRQHLQVQNHSHGTRWIWKKPSRETAIRRKCSAAWLRTSLSAPEPTRIIQSTIWTRSGKTFCRVNQPAEGGRESEEKPWLPITVTFVRYQSRLIVITCLKNQLRSPYIMKKNLVSLQRVEDWSHLHVVWIIPSQQNVASNRCQPRLLNGIG